MRKLLFILMAVTLLVSCKEDKVQKSQIVGILKLESEEVLGFTTVILKQDGITVKQTSTDDKGLFVLDNLDAGTYQLFGYSEEYKLSKPLEIVVEAEKSISIEFIFEPNISVVGLVTTNPIGGVALEQIRVEVYDAVTLKYIGSTRATREGLFYLYDLKPGDYNLQAYEYYWLNYYSETTFRLSDNQPLEIYIQLTKRTK